MSFPMVSSIFQGHAPIAGLLKCHFVYSCEAVDKISLTVRRGPSAVAELLVSHSYCIAGLL